MSATATFEPIAKLSRDLRAAGATLSRGEARFLVDAYYGMQKDRIRLNHQIRQLSLLRCFNCDPAGLTVKSEKHLSGCEDCDSTEVFVNVGYVGTDRRTVSDPRCIECSPRDPDEPMNLCPFCESTLAGEPHEVISWFAVQARQLEDQLKAALHSYALSEPIGQWLMSITGIGPVITAGLLAHIDITKTKTVSGLWRFAGQDPSAKWEKGQKRPWNAALKRLCFLASESFVKTSNLESSFYGPHYKARKREEIDRNNSGRNAEYAKMTLETKNIGKKTMAYKAYAQGKLPDAQVHRRSARWTVKMFLAHLFVKMYRETYRMEPPRLWVLEHGGHVHYIDGPE